MGLLSCFDQHILSTFNVLYRLQKVKLHSIDVGQGSIDIFFSLQVDYKFSSHIFSFQDVVCNNVYVSERYLIKL